jgi:Protein of unknown function (DUF2934)
MSTIVKNEVNSDPEELDNTINISEPDTRIAELAYCKAENRGFEQGHELENWLEAEQEFMP